MDNDSRMNCLCADDDGGARARLLLVDDHEGTRRVTRRLLQMAGYDVVTAAGVQEALTTLEAGPVDLMICDLVLPDGDGWDLMSEAKRRATAGGFEMVGLAVSGCGQPEDLERSRSVGFAQHLVKPLQWESLAEAVGQALRKDQ